MKEDAERSTLAISPPSDIVLDVARAAAPADIAAARLELQRRATASGAATATFVEKAAAGRPDMRADSASAASMKADGTKAGGAKAGEQAFRKFEAMVLQTFVQSMLPNDSEAVFGKGLAGEMWKSQLAEQLAGVIARRGGIGIANRLLKDHYVAGEKAVPLAGAEDGPARAEADRQHMLSVALVQEMQRRLSGPVALEPQDDRKG